MRSKNLDTQSKARVATPILPSRIRGFSASFDGRQVLDNVDLDKQIAEAFANADHELGRSLSEQKEQAQQELNSLYTERENFLNS